MTRHYVRTLAAKRLEKINFRNLSFFNQNVQNLPSAVAWFNFDGSL